MLLGGNAYANAHKKCIEGDCINGLGTATYPEGDKYVGGYKDGDLNGKGTLTFPDGVKYVGEWKKGEFVK